MKKTDIGVVGFIYAVAVLFLVMTLELPADAQTYPLFIIFVLAFLNTMYVIKMIHQAKKHGVKSGLEDFEGFLPKQFFPCLGMMILYLVLIYIIGFYISTLLFMIISLLFLKVKKWQIVLATLVIILLVFCAFKLFLGVDLPVGLVFE